VNDVLDLKTIEKGNYDHKLEKFSPKQILEFVKNLFQPQSKMLGTQIISEEVPASYSELAFQKEPKLP